MTRLLIIFFYCIVLLNGSSIIAQEKGDIFLQLGGNYAFKSNIPTYVIETGFRFNETNHGLQLDFSIGDRSKFDNVRYHTSIDYFYRYQLKNFKPLIFRAIGGIGYQHYDRINSRNKSYGVGVNIGAETILQIKKIGLGVKYRFAYARGYREEFPEELINGTFSEYIKRGDNLYFPTLLTFMVSYNL